MSSEKKLNHGRSDRFVYKPMFSNLIMAPIVTASFAGYYGAMKHNNWSYYLKNKMFMGKAVVSTFGMLTVLNLFYSTNIKSLNPLSKEKPDFKQIKKDIEQLGMIQDDSSKRRN